MINEKHLTFVNTTIQLFCKKKRKLSDMHVYFNHCHIIITLTELWAAVFDLSASNCPSPCSSPLVWVGLHFTKKYKRVKDFWKQLIYLIKLGLIKLVTITSACLIKSYPQTYKMSHQVNKKIIWKDKQIKTKYKKKTK